VNVAAVVVTRGDQNIVPVLASLPEGWEHIVWDNSREQDMGVYGRYAAIERTAADLIYVQDDDVIVNDPDTILLAWKLAWRQRVLADDTGLARMGDLVVCNMPPEFRHSFYEHHALVGFGAVFHRTAPARAFERFREAWPVPVESFQRTCDIVFTGLTPRVLVDVPRTDLHYAHHETRMWKQPRHQADRVRMLDLVRTIAA
jgi:hypothetical protein